MDTTAILLSRDGGLQPDTRRHHPSTDRRGANTTAPLSRSQEGSGGGLQARKRFAGSRDDAFQPVRLKSLSARLQTIMALVYRRSVMKAQ